MSFCGELKVGTFHNGVHRARFLAKATVDTFRHINIISARKKKHSLSFLKPLYRKEIRTAGDEVEQEQNEHSEQVPIEEGKL
jgi:hypothetical protein